MFKHFANCVVVVAMLALASPVFAKSFSQTIEINQPATIGDTSLQPGSYKFVADLDSGTVRVERGRKVVATVHGKTVTLKNKAPYGSVVVDGGKVQEIQFQGKSEAIDLPNS